MKLILEVHLFEPRDVNTFFLKNKVKVKEV
jgi:hypothetical protein